MADAIPQQMRAMVLDAAGKPLALQQLRVPEPAADEVLIRVSACGICRTDLHVVDGELADPALPLVPGHQIVGRVVACGADVEPEQEPRARRADGVRGAALHPQQAMHGRADRGDEAVR